MQSEKIIDLSGSEHWELLSDLFSKVNKDEISKILDAGSGRTSLSCLLKFFENASVDAVVYPGDQRKIDSVKTNVISDRYKLMEFDICKELITTEYDLVLAHLLLGEAAKWGNDFKDLLKKLLEIKAKYFVIFDIAEDPLFNSDYVEGYIKNSGMQLLSQLKIAKKEPQVFPEFTAKNYIAYLIKSV